jgi:hypothetical protein
VIFHIQDGKQRLMDGNTECNSQLSQPAVSASEPGEPNEDDDTFAIETTQNPAMSAPAKRLRHNQEEPVQEETVQEETVQQHQRQRQRDERDRRARDRDLATVGLLETCETIISPEPPRAIHGVWMQFPLNADSLEVLQGVYRHIANALDAAGLVEHPDDPAHDENKKEIARANDSAGPVEHADHDDPARDENEKELARAADPAGLVERPDDPARNEKYDEHGSDSAETLRFGEC